MQKITRNIRIYLHKTGRVLVRVRWNKSKSECTFSAECSADTSKWNTEAGRAKLNTTHTVNGNVYTAKEINSRLENIEDLIHQAMYQYEVQDKLPSVAEFKDAVNKMLKPTLADYKLASENGEDIKGLYLQDLLEDFVTSRPKELNWGPKVHLRYKEVVDKYHTFASKTNVRLMEINKQQLLDFKQWFFDTKVHAKPYSNYTIMKRFRDLQGMLRWGRENGYKIHPESLSFKSNIQLIDKTVTFLYYDEIEKLANFEFPKGEAYLDHIRDVFCFGCYTSLRHSDLYALRKANIKGDTIEIVTQKTDDRLHIPLIPQAKAILDKYKDLPGDYALPVVSDRKSNAHIRKAAQLAGLDRDVWEEKMEGNKRVGKVYKLYETISMHDARRSFVCNSLAFGIPASVVSACTGHSDLTTMRPYIATADSSVKREMKKWTYMPIRQRIDAILDDANEDQLQDIYDMLVKAV